MAKNVITVRNVSKSFGKVQAVRNLSFQVESGTCFGLLGPNGAGKTTMMKMIYAKCTREKDSDDTLEIFGYDPIHEELAIKYLSGVVPQENNLDEELNVVQNLMIYSKFYSLSAKVARERIDNLLGFLELSEKRRSKIKELSGGMKRRLVVARALLNEPKLLILDEPTTGLDPQVRHLIWDKLRQLRSQGTTILLTTHYMEEAFQLCDTVLIMHKGEKVMQDTPQNLLKENIETFVLELPAGDLARTIRGEGLPSQIRVERFEGTTRLYCDSFDELKAVTTRIEGSQYYLRQSNLEDVFLKATGRALNDKQ
ncbi:MAG: ABC transporter ATP-binding protein [Phycisphaerales bacterium]|nr:MAG: ABC transporter ATP-binding protein [Phycisphaerales bacterium]